MFNSIDSNHVTNCYVKMVNVFIFHGFHMFYNVYLNDDYLWINPSSNEFTRYTGQSQMTLEITKSDCFMQINQKYVQTLSPLDNNATGQALGTTLFDDLLRSIILYTRIDVQIYI